MTIKVIGIIIVAIFAIVFLGVWLCGLEQKSRLKNGENYEKSVASQIENIIGSKPSRNIIMQRNDGEPTEADMVFVNKKGVFCVECKFRSDNSMIYAGPLMDERIELQKGNRCIDYTLNPVIQNKMHIVTLSKKIGIPVEKIYNVVYTSIGFNLRNYGKEHLSYKRRCYMAKDINVAWVNGGIIKDGTKAFKEDINSLPDIFNDDEVAGLNELLKSMEASKEQREEFASYQRIKDSVDDELKDYVKSKIFSS